MAYTITFNPKTCRYGVRDTRTAELVAAGYASIYQASAQAALLNMRAEGLL